MITHNYKIFMDKEKFLLLNSHVHFKRSWRLEIPKDYENKRLANCIVLFNVQNGKVSKAEKILVSVYKPH